MTLVGHICVTQQSIVNIQSQTRILDELTHQDLRWHSICWSQIKSMTQADKRYRKAFHCDKHWCPRMADVPTIDVNGLSDV
jgi:hypothetical protein